MNAKAPTPGERAAALFKSALDAPDERLPQVIAEALPLLDDAEPALRKVALEVLGHAAAFRGYKVAPLTLRKVFALSRDEWDAVRAEAADTLSLIPGVPEPERTQTLISLLDDEAALVREDAAAALGDLTNPLAADALARHLEDVSDNVRFECALALGRIHDTRAFDGLVAGLERKWDRIYAADVLGQLGDARAVPALTKMASKLWATFQERLNAWGALYRLGERWAGDKIVSRTRSWSRPEREMATWMIGHAQVHDGARVLIELAKHPKHVLGEAAVEGLGELDDPGAAGTLEAIAADEKRPLDVRLHAINALGKRRDDVRRRALEGLAKSSSPEIAGAAKTELEVMNP